MGVPAYAAEHTTATGKTTAVGTGIAAAASDFTAAACVIASLARSCLQQSRAMDESGQLSCALQHAIALAAFVPSSRHMLNEPAEMLATTTRFNTVATRRNR